MPTRDHDVSRLSATDLERAMRELRASLALVRPDSPARVPIEAHISAIDAEQAERERLRPSERWPSREQPFRPPELSP